MITLNQDEVEKIKAVRATCHGFAAAMAAALNGDGVLNLEVMKAKLQAHNAALTGLLESNGIKL